MGQQGSDNVRSQGELKGKGGLQNDEDVYVSVLREGDASCRSSVQMSDTTRNNST